MPKIAYQTFRFAPETLSTIEQANKIIAEYQAQGFTLTLRQLYYQFVARDLIKNKQTEYKRIGSIINDGRLAGLIDWTAIEDRTRSLRSLSSWSDPSSIIESAARSFHTDRWANQSYRPEVWIEKDALIGVIEGICEQWDVPYFSCRGYTSQSEMWGAAQRLRRHARLAGGAKTPVIFHLGDHDPSGIDMSRDILDRLSLFMGEYADKLVFKRLALNMTQVKEYDPPPNFAKTTDSRAEDYISQYGEDSWELDALEPSIISGLINGAVEGLVNKEQWAQDAHNEEMMRADIQAAADRWDDVSSFLKETD